MWSTIRVSGMSVVCAVRQIKSYCYEATRRCDVMCRAVARVLFKNTVQSGYTVRPKISSDDVEPSDAVKMRVIR
jgi:hypothetical protein